MRARFDRIFKRKTGFVTLDRLLARLHANKPELLMVLDRPEIPLHTNGSENDIRCQVTKRKVSGGTRSDVGRDCRDAFLGLAKTCAKLGIAFWDYLGARLAVPGSPAIPICRNWSPPNPDRPDRPRVLPLLQLFSLRSRKSPSAGQNVRVGGRFLREFDAQRVEARRVNEIIAETAALVANLDLVRLILSHATKLLRGDLRSARSRACRRPIEARQTYGQFFRFGFAQSVSRLLLTNITKSGIGKLGGTSHSSRRSNVGLAARALNSASGRPCSIARSSQ